MADVDGPRRYRVVGVRPTSKSNHKITVQNDDNTAKRQKNELIQLQIDAKRQALRFRTATFVLIFGVVVLLTAASVYFVAVTAPSQQMSEVIRYLFFAILIILILLISFFCYYKVKNPKMRLIDIILRLFSKK